MKKVVVVGSGGHAKVVIDILQAMKDVEIYGITSTSLAAGTTFSGYPVLGDDSWLVKEMSQEYIIAMGLGGYRDNRLRENIYTHFKSLGFEFINAIHPSAVISSTVRFGEAVVIFPGVVLNTEVVIGNNSIVATGSTIDHETLIGNHVLVSAGVTVGAYTTILDNALLALGSKVISGITIGSGAVVAAGAVVVKNVPDDEMVFGIPASSKKQKT